MGAPRGGARVFSRGGGKARHTGVRPPAPPTSVSARRRPRAAKDAVAAGATADIDDAPPAGPTTHLRFGGLGGAGQDEAEAVASAGAGAPRVPLTGALAASLCVDRRKLKATAASYTHVDDLTTLSSLAVVDLSNNALTDISGLAGCVNLGHVNVSSNRLTSLQALLSLTRLVVLNASRNNISSTDFAVRTASAGTLSALVLAGNGLRELQGVSRLQHLNTLVLSHNAFEEFPSLGVLPGLRKLSLSHNGLRALPPTTPSAVPALSELRLAHNKLASLPPATALAPWSARLRVLDVGHNRIRSFADPASMLVGVRVLSVSGNATADTGTWATVRVLDGARVDGCGRGGRPLDPAAVAAAAAARAEREAAAIAGAGDATGRSRAVGSAATEDKELDHVEAPAAGRPTKRARRAAVASTATMTDLGDASEAGEVTRTLADDAPAVAGTDVPPLSFDDVARFRGVASTTGGDAALGGVIAAGAGAANEDDDDADLLAASAADAAATVVRVTVARRAKEKGRSKRQRARAKREAETAAQAEAGVEERFGLGGESAW